MKQNERHLRLKSEVLGRVERLCVMEKSVDTMFVYSLSLVFNFVQELAHFALLGKEVEILR